MLVPIFWSLGYTFFNGNAINGFKFIGLDNFAEFFNDPAALAGARGSPLKYAVVLTVGQVAVGYGLALLYVFWLRKAVGIVRTLVFFPVVLPTVAVALLFQQLFEIAPQDGPGQRAHRGPRAAHPVDWFGNAGTRRSGCIVLMDIWRSMGFYAVLLYAGLSTSPTTSSSRPGSTARRAGSSSAHRAAAVLPGAALLASSSASTARSRSSTRSSR